MNKKKIFITGAGGPAAICAFKSLSKENYDLYMGDMDPLSTGLYLVSATKRSIIPAAREAGFVDSILEVCIKNEIDVLIPTVDMELIQLAARKKEFEAVGTRVLVADAGVLEKIMNKHNLLTALKDDLDVGQFDMLSNSTPDQWKGKKVVIKPISGSGSRGVEIHPNYASIDEEKLHAEEMMIQEFLEGPEYSVDVMVDEEGEVRAAVPRLRLRTDSGVSMTGLVDKNEAVIAYAKAVAEKIGLTFAGNIQIIVDPDLGPRLVEINPRFSGGLSLVIEAGANTPSMCVRSLLGERVETINDFRELAMVRSFNETYLDASELIRA